MVDTPTCILEVRTTGDDTNGGGFDNGVASPGTDYSQQDSAQITYTDLVIDNFDNTKVTSAANPFDSTCPGNLINISSGFPFNGGVYVVESVSGSTAKLSSVVGNTGSTGGHGKLGGAYQTLSQATNNMMIGGQIVYMKGGTYQISSGILPPLIVGSSTYTSLGRIVGYSTIRGDGGRITIQATGGSVMFSASSSATWTSTLSWENIVFDGNSTTVRCIDCNLPAFVQLQFLNCIFKNFAGTYIIGGSLNEFAGGLNIQRCEFTNNALSGGSTGGIVFFSCNGSYPEAALSVTESYFANNSVGQSSVCAAIYVAGAGVNIARNIIYNNTGTNMSGILLRSPGAGCVQNNDIVSNTLAGITLIADTGPNVSITNNIISGSATGITGSWATTPTILAINHNAYWNNTTNKSGFTAGSGEVSLSSSPFVSAGTNFALNSTAGGGLACQGAGTPGSIGLSSVVGTGSLDIGALQHGASSGGAFTFVD
jgi:hypothetical protein